MSQKCNRKRTNRVHVYLSDDEYRTFLDNVQKSGLSISDYCRQQLTNGQVISAPPADFRKLIWELKRMGTNLDQVLFKLNAIGEYEQDDLNSCAEEIHDIVKLLYKTFNRPGGS